MSAPYPARGFDLNNAAIQANPYPAYAWLRENAPLFKLDGVPMWVVSRHAEIEAILRDHTTFASNLGMHVPLMSIVMQDAPDHTRLRQTVNRAFTPRAVAHLAPRISEIAHALLDAWGRGEKEPTPPPSRGEGVVSAPPPPSTSCTPTPTRSPSPSSAR
ncbi:MAG: hypothetical protein P4L71_14440 [Acetobacteraceae bacterium]|nr:hypothetical protein [Acetobacteraceae bacterium]